MKTNALGGSASSSSASLSPASAAARSQVAEVGRGGGLRVAEGGRAAVPDGLAPTEGDGRALAEAEAGSDCLSSFCPTRNATAATTSACCGQSPFGHAWRAAVAEHELEQRRKAEKQERVRALLERERAAERDGAVEVEARPDGELGAA